MAPGRRVKPSRLCQHLSLNRGSPLELCPRLEQGSRHLRILDDDTLFSGENYRLGLHHTETLPATAAKPQRTDGEQWSRS